MLSFILSVSNLYSSAVQRQNLLCAFFLRMKMFRSEVLVFGVGTATLVLALLFWSIKF